MQILDEPLLQLFRDTRRCEVCGKRGPVQPHHLLARGIGGGGRLDIRANLVAVCFGPGTKDCHGRIHQGIIKRDTLWLIVAKREKRSVASLQEEVWRLRRTRR